MRRIEVFNRVTADGSFADAEGRLDWFVADEELDAEARNSLGSHDAMLLGRKTYEMFESFWPHALEDPQGASDPHAAGRRSPAIRDMAKWINATTKLVVSRTRQEVTWNGSRLVRELTRESVEALKREPGGDIIVFGSGELVTQLTALGLVDEYQLVVSPLFGGARGRRMLGVLPAIVGLELLGTRQTAAGNVVLRYAPRR